MCFFQNPRSHSPPSNILSAPKKEKSNSPIINQTLYLLLRQHSVTTCTSTPIRIRVCISTPIPNNDFFLFLLLSFPNSRPIMRQPRQLQLLARQIEVLRADLYFPVYH